VLKVLLTTMDCADALALSAFWAEALGYEFRVRTEGWVILGDPAREGVGLGFQRVPEPKAVKNRVHLDLLVTGEPIEARRATLEALGATTQRFVDNGEEGHHYIMQDPEGNEFCLH
jgi:predicted enzyme related to lactoylglutathione lyase